MSNNQEEILLSICVPTYKLPDGIRRLFSNLAEQETAGVEILIRDDSPDDLTENLVKDFVSKNSINIRYFRGEKASVGGYDTALLFLIEEAKGRFIFWYGDDVMAPGALAKILQLIRENSDLSLIWINTAGIENNQDLGIRLPADRFFDDPNEILEVDVGLLGFTSIIRRDLALTGLAEAKKFIGSALACFYLVLHVLSQRRGRSFFLRQPLIFCEAKPVGEIRWYDSFQVHGFNYYLIGLKFRKKFKRKSFRRAFGDQFGQIWRAVLVERARGFTTGFGMKISARQLWQMARFYWSFPELWIALPLFLLPRPILKFLYGIYKKFFPEHYQR